MINFNFMLLSKKNKNKKIDKDTYNRIPLIWHFREGKQ